MLTNDESTQLRRVFDRDAPKTLTRQHAEQIVAETGIALRRVEWFALDQGIWPVRYERNAGTLGTTGQQALLGASVVVVGLGGLGGHVVEALARIGVGRIAGVDHDVFDESNLNRQGLAHQQNLGQKKVDAAAERVRRINSAVEFAPYNTSFSEVSHDVCRRADLAFDCLDNMPDRLALAERCSSADVPLVHGAIAGWYGQVAVIWPDSNALETIYTQARTGLEQQLGNPCFTAGLAGNLMVSHGIRILTQQCADKRSTLLFFDLLENEWQSIPL